MNLHETMKQFQQLDYAVVGKEVKHPSSSNKELSNALSQFFSFFVKLTHDRDYVEFLEIYGGAAIIYPDYDFVLGINGTSLDVVENILYPDESLVEDGRFFRFADITIQPLDNLKAITGISFAFDISSQTRLGIYRKYVGPNISLEQGLKQPYEWYCESFLNWLVKVIEVKGELIM